MDEIQGKEGVGGDVRGECTRSRAIRSRQRQKISFGLRCASAMVAISRARKFSARPSKRLYPWNSQDEAFMPLSRADGIVGNGESRREIQLAGGMADVTGVVVLGSEEPLGHAEIGAADQEADLVCGRAHGFGPLEQTGRHIEGA